MDITRLDQTYRLTDKLRGARVKTAPFLVKLSR
jgi:hypothetical protein